MSDTFTGRIKHAWNAFRNRDSLDYVGFQPLGYSYGTRPDRLRFNLANERTLVASIYNKIAIDVSDIDIRHVRLDDNGRYLEDVDSGLNNCLTIEANIDQAARAFRQDMAATLLEKGTIAIVPVDTTDSPEVTASYDIKTMRVAEITSWYPQHVGLRLYNDRTGSKEDIILPKSMVAIVENPLYSVMNEPNSTLQRLTRKLSLLDTIDEEAASGKLDIIMQLPYVIKTDARREQAERRRKDIEEQLTGSQYGIAYTDGTERITQLNRPAENDLFRQVEYYTNMLYGQLGLTADVFNGTADEKTMLNYYNRTVEPILTAITEAMIRTFLTKTARSQKQSIRFFRDPFKLVAVSDIAEIADKFTRNEILSSNEVRDIIGRKPVNIPEADELRNKNLPKIKEDPETSNKRLLTEKEGELQNGIKT